MAEKTIDQNPRITDTVVFRLTTPDANGCSLANPYKIDNVTIYYVARDFISSNFGTFDDVTYSTDLLAQVQAADAAMCTDPSPANILASQQLHAQLIASAQHSSFVFSDALVVDAIGSAANPAWLSTDPNSSFITNLPLDQNNNPQYSVFEYKWNPLGSVREGDYFICWTWTPLAAGGSLSSTTLFSLLADPMATAALPTHTTVPGKYEDLLDRYLPDMYKQYISDDDITPETLESMNKAIAKGFNFLEDFANQVIDLYDANAVHETFLVYLANLFGLKLKSDDPTLWRRQIKEAVPLFKKKGTLPGLQQAFAQAGMKLNSIQNLWQVVSQYTWQESFLVGSSATFNLQKLIYTPTNNVNFKLWIRRSGTTDYVPLSLDYVSFEPSDCSFFSTMTWVGDTLSSNSLQLFEGDILRVLYQYAPIPSGGQAIENFFQTLPLADQRDEAAQVYPPKNWNVRLIEEDDPMFQVMVPVTHPFHDPLIFGKIRTEFPYSENIYNMEEWNGSTRDSFDPCDIDKSFIDPCGACLSSKYNADVSVEELSDVRIAEVHDVLREFTPFHSVLNTLKLNGQVNEFVTSPVEDVDFLITYNISDPVLSGDGNREFNRIRDFGLTTNIVTRSDLAKQVTVVSNRTATAYNQYVAIITPDVNLQDLGVIVDNHILQVLSPSSNSGTYTIKNIVGHVAQINSGSVLEPIDQSVFTFTLSNVMYSTATGSITQANEVLLSDGSQDLSQYALKTNWDVTHNSNLSGGLWSISIPTYSVTPFVIDQLLPDGTLSLADPNRVLPSSNVTGVSYSLIDGEGNVVTTGVTGKLAVNNRGLVNLNDLYIVDINQIVRHGDYLYYNGTEYLILSLVGNNFYIENYNNGDAVGVNIDIRRRLVPQSYGYFGYAGLKLSTSANYELDLGVLNGTNPPSTDPNQITDNSFFKENFLIQIGNDFYKIADINGTDITLDGLAQDWMTLAAGGTLVTFNILQFVRTPASVDLTVFADGIKRTDMDVIHEEIESTVSQNVALQALSLPNGTNLSELTQQQEEVTFEIEWADGNITKGTL